MKGYEHVVLGVALCAALSLNAGCGSSDSEAGFQPIGTGGAAASGAGGMASTSGSGGTGGNASSSSGMDPPKLGAPYPIVLAHGFFGFETFAGIDFLEYHYQVKQYLADHGEPLVFTPAVDPFNSSAYRGQQLATHIEAILEQTGHDKVIIIGHSQGGLDARVVAHEHPEMVAAVVTLQTPHYGTPIADIALKVVANPNLQGVVDFFLQAVGAPLYDEIGESTSLAKPLYDFSEAGITQFNGIYTNQAGVYYASVAGRSDWHTGGLMCNVSSAPDFIKAYDNELDPIDPLFDLTEMMLDGGITNPYPNDGLVRVNDAMWGEFLGCVPADHMDMIGQLFGDSPGLGNSFDHQQFYLDLVGLLRDKGL